MKKIIFFIIIAIAITGCSAFRSVDISQVTTGMTKAQVRNILGAPDRVLSTAQIENGFQEVLQYRTSGGDVYAIQFVNDYLTGYEFLYEDVMYVAPPPPVVLPPPGRPIYPPSRPPHRPDPPEQPQEPTPPERPGRPPGYPDGPSTQPSPPSRPDNKPDLTKPADDRNSSRPATRPVNTKEPRKSKR